MPVAIDRTDTVVEEGDASRTGRPFRLPAVDRAISLFELLANSESGLTLSELSRKLDIPKSTTHYLVYTLATRGYVRRAESGRYFLGTCFAQLASARMGAAESDLGRLAAPCLRRIVAKVNLTAALTVLKGAESLVIATISSAQGGGGGAWIGRHIDLHCNAQGKALIAFLPDEELNKIFAGREFAPFTHKTILSLPALKRHLAQVRSQGYAVCDEEYFQGFRAVAAPIFDSPAFDSSHRAIAAISVRGSTKEVPSSRIPELGQEMIRAAKEIAAGLRVT